MKHKLPISSRIDDLPLDQIETTEGDADKTLSDSVAALGVLQWPVVVATTAKRFAIVDGRKRVAAVRAAFPERQTLRVHLVDEDLSPLERLALRFQLNSRLNPTQLCKETLELALLIGDATLDGELKETLRLCFAHADHDFFERLKRVPKLSAPMQAVLVDRKVALKIMDFTTDIPQSILDSFGVFAENHKPSASELGLLLELMQELIRSEYQEEKLIECIVEANSAQGLHSKFLSMRFPHREQQQSRLTELVKSAQLSKKIEIHSADNKEQPVNLTLKFHNVKEYQELLGKSQELLNDSAFHRYLEER